MGWKHLVGGAVTTQLVRYVPIVCLAAVTGSSFVEYQPLGVPLAPTNVSLAQILATAAIIQWEAGVHDHITRFQLTVTPIAPPVTETTTAPPPGAALHRIIADVDGIVRRHELKGLAPNTEYEVYIQAYNTEGRSNSSDVVLFRTVSDGTEMRKLYINPGEIIVVLLILCAWFCAIGLFLNKWGKIRITHSSEPRYKHAPKNLDTIKVVKKNSDSVIYKTHPKDSLYTKTMDARNKRLERMNTMPNIKVDLLKGKEKDKCKEPKRPAPDSRKFARNNTDPMIEMETVFSKEKDRRRKDLYRPPPPVVEVDEEGTITAGSVV